jgi:TolB-like protein/AraC-like DNA-binding protein/Tfp pilus assembly protein PilF
MTEPLTNNQIFIRRLTEIIHANLTDEDFGVKELAHELGMSPYRINRKLNSINKKTCNQFIRDVRLEKAYELLQDEIYTVAEVAFKTGFGSSNYFNKCFHEYFGYPPGSVKKADLDKDKEINPAKVAVKKEQKRLIRRTLILISSGILFLVALSYLVPNIFFKNSFADTENLSKSTEKSIAVLPFKNLSDSTNNQYFIDGIMEDILTNLSRIHDLKVISRTSVEQFREPRKSTSEIAKKLNVGYIIEGSGQKYGNTFRLRVQLIEASTDKHIWAESYEQVIAEPKDIFSIQSRIAQSIATELNAKITPQEQELIEKTPTQSLTAYDLCQRGYHELSKYGMGSTNYEAMNRAEYLFHDALKYDSAYASAYLGLAAVYWKKMDLEGSSSGKDILDSYLDSMLVMTNIAISLDDQQAEAYYLRGGYYIAKGNEKQALEEWDIAIVYDPNNTNPYWCKGWFYTGHDLIKSIENFEKVASLSHGLTLPEVLTTIGEDYYLAGFPDYGKKYLTNALELEGDSVKYLDSYIYYLAENQGEYKKAITYFEKRCQADSTNDLILLRLAFYNSLDGDYEESLKYYNKYFLRLRNINQVSRSWDKQMMEYHFGYINMKLGNKKVADNYNKKALVDYARYVNSASEHIKRIFVYRLAALYASIGENDKAYENLKILGNDQCFVLKDLILIKNDPLFNGIRNDLKFQKIVRDVESKYQAEHERVRKWLVEQGKL